MDGKVVAKEVRYVAETADMDRDGPMDTPSDWDSLSDRVRKAKRQQKTILQQHRGYLPYLVKNILNFSSTKYNHFK